MIRNEDILLFKKSGEPGLETSHRSRTALLIRRLIAESIEVGATDIHVEPEEGKVRIRARVDGFLRDVTEYDTASGMKVVAAIKVLCDLDITRKHRMQDGSFSAKVEGRLVEFRVSSVEELQGDKMVIRILETRPEVIDMQRLGLPAATETELRGFLRQSQGMLLVSGPTGSGKSTTLYSLLREVDRKQRNVVAIEDPIEYRLDYVTQIAVDAKHGVTFASALRNSLRQDPNIIMLGEIRDAETAQIAIQAGLTGHLVFSTVHARDSAATVHRLLDLDIEAFLVANVINVSLAQRLVRILCRACRKKAAPERALAEKFGMDPGEQVWEAAGCDVCQGAGYRGRTGVFELMRVTKRIQGLIMDRGREDDIRKVAIEEGMLPIQRAAMEKVRVGVTSMAEVNRVLG
ncbi:MAG: type II/IV secretion system protein [Candidatus Brocadiae bacterium]|nr:type II/IV secretion system protein [Candidatus Brocadiia bacterium]